MCPISGAFLLDGKAGASAPLHLVGKFALGFLRDGAPFPARKRRFRLIDGGQDFRTGRSRSSHMPLPKDPAKEVSSAKAGAG